MAQLIQFYLSHRSDIVPLWNSLFFSTGRIPRLFTQTNTKMYFKLFLKFVYSIKNEFKCKLEQINYLFLFHEIIKTKLKNIYALFSFFIIMQYRIRRILARVNLVNLAFKSKNWVLMIKLNLSDVLWPHYKLHYVQTSCVFVLKSLANNVIIIGVKRINSP